MFGDARYCFKVSAKDDNQSKLGMWHLQNGLCVYWKNTVYWKTCMSAEKYRRSAVNSSCCCGVLSSLLVTLGTRLWGTAVRCPRWVLCAGTGRTTSTGAALPSSQQRGGLGWGTASAATGTGSYLGREGHKARSAAVTRGSFSPVAHSTCSWRGGRNCQGSRYCLTFFNPSSCTAAGPARKIREITVKSTSLLWLWKKRKSNLLSFISFYF